MTKNIKPVWLLDVDGVINACTFPHFPDTFPKDTWRLEMVAPGDPHMYAAPGPAYPIRFSTEVVDFINHMADIVDIRWHTTWQDSAITHLSPALGIRTDIPVMIANEFRNTNHNKYWWKMPAALRVVNDEERTLIWTDDDLSGSEIRHFSENIAWDNTKHLLITPDTVAGLTPANLERIEEFAQENAEVRAR